MYDIIYRIFRVIIYYQRMLEINLHELIIVT